MIFRVALVVLLCIFSLSRLCAKENIVPISVAVRAGQDGLGDNSLKLLSSKIRTALAANGVVADGKSGIVVCPTFNITNKQVIEGGMRKITVFDVELTMSVQNVLTGIEFFSISMPLRGEGYSENEACLSAVRKIQPSDKKMQSLLKDGSKKVVEYYDAHLSALIKTAQTKASMKEYEEALALLSQYPTFLPGYGTVVKAMVDIYVKWQDDVCSQTMMKARNAFSTGDYELASSLLGEVDMKSSCAEEVKRLSEDIRKSISAEKARELDLYKEQMRTAADLEKRRLKAIENVAKAYYGKQDTYVYVGW